MPWVPGTIPEWFMVITIRVLFTAAPEFAVQAAGLGHFIASPVTPTEIVEYVRYLLEGNDFRPC
jgi:hypothetical protein